MILMNGESGSGKTETFKYAIDFFAKTTCKKEKLRNKLLNVTQKLDHLSFFIIQGNLYYNFCQYRPRLF
jgi:myosin heavy subunit